ncbi:MAG: hypothetical protein AB1454_01745 [Candidatus Auribacterota bacterium]|jgi:hypothetical protein|uniref:Secreted protein n=1 Tax=Candidatus Auribacter fodinae TaxID=2093366 RepID=A0A3A4R7R5_9BACT|nr:MAG: hypothetical protein C4541_02915 [Candidatus Auribacter fodinae]
MKKATSVIILSALLALSAIQQIHALPALLAQTAPEEESFEMLPSDEYIETQYPDDDYMMEEDNEGEVPAEE